MAEGWLPGYHFVILLQAASSEACQLEQVDSKGKEKSSGNFQKSSGSKNTGAKKRKLHDA